MDFQTFCDVPALSGDEHDLHQVLAHQYENLGLKVLRDQLGSVFGLQSVLDSPFRVMLSANLDESGGIIQAIRPDGLIDFVTLGRYSQEDYLNQPVRLLTRSHQPHRGYGVQVEGKVYLAVGAKSATQVDALGLQVGDAFVLDWPLLTIGQDCWLGRNLSNRVALTLSQDIMKVVGKDLNYDLAIGGISQSLVGTRGAITATNLIQPDLALVLDASPVADYDSQSLYLRYFDKTLLPNKALLTALKEVAEDLGYRVRGQVQEVGTDGAFIHKTGTGVPTVVITIPLLQSPGMLQCCDPASLEPIRQTLQAFLVNLDASQVAKFCFQGQVGEGR